MWTRSATTSAVDALAAQERLKSDRNPVGLQPGEAAAFVLLESPEAARRRKARVLAHVAGVATAEDPRTKDDPPVGEGLALALGRLAAESGALPPGETWFLSDRNGEAVRANDWGYCQQRLTARMPGLLPASEWTIATSLGDTGAASGALATAVVVRSFARAYAPGRCAVILSCGGRPASARHPTGTGRISADGKKDALQGRREGKDSYRPGREVRPIWELLITTT